MKGYKDGKLKKIKKGKGKGKGRKGKLEKERKRGKRVEATVPAFISTNKT